MHLGVRDHRVSIDRTTSFHLLAATALGLALLSATLTAALDAGSIATRVSGTSIDARPLWLHTFSIAMI